MTDDAHRQLTVLLPTLERFALVLTGSRTEAQDLVQSAVERALIAENIGKNNRNIASWLFKVMQNLWIDTQRAAARGRLQSYRLQGRRAEDGRRTLAARSELREVCEAFSTLPEAQQVILSLVVIEGMSYREVAQALGVPVGTVMSRLARARATLADQFEGPAHGTSH